MFKRCYFFNLVIIFLFCYSSIFASDCIVILGSSTAFGYGTSSPDSSWVSRFKKYVQLIDSNNEVINLAKGGFTTYNIMPSDYIPQKGKRYPDVNCNITMALKYNPQAIIINLPTNDTECGYTIMEQINNYKVIVEAANKVNVHVWITTPQPRTNFDYTHRQKLVEMKDSLCRVFKNRVIDFWTELELEDGEINPIYSFKDGIHLNDLGHKILYEKVVETNILKEINDPIIDKERDRLFAYPNPFIDVVHLSNYLTIKSLYIIDLQGRIVSNFLNLSADVNLSNLNPGIYFLKIIDKNNCITNQCLIKKK